MITHATFYLTEPVCACERSDYIALMQGPPVEVIVKCITCGAQVGVAWRKLAIAIEVDGLSLQTDPPRAEGNVIPFPKRS